MKFGIEIESTGARIRNVRDNLIARGIDAQDDGYHHQTRPYWRVTEDGSLTSPGTEVVSPILTGKALRYGQTLADVTASVVAAGGTIDRSCGLHVHHDAGMLDGASLTANWQKWMLWQPVIDMLVPPSRRGQRDYCGRDLSSYGPNTYIRLSKKGMKGQDLAYQAGRIDRYTNFNVAAYAQHGTVEFRQHSGTLNPEKISNWVRFTELFMDPYAAPMDLFGTDHLSYAREKLDIPNERPTSGVGIEHWVTEMILRLGGDEALTTYYLARANSLAGRASADREDEQSDSFNEPDRDNDNGCYSGDCSCSDHSCCYAGTCNECEGVMYGCEPEHFCW